MIRYKSLKTRTAVANAFLIVVILLANAVYLVITKRSELRSDVEQRAQAFALLTRHPICEAFLDSPSDPGRLRDVLRAYLGLEPSVDRILIAGRSGAILFDSSEAGGTAAAGSPRRVEEPAHLAAIARPEPSRIPARDASGGEAIEIVLPHLDERGRHGLSVSYRVSYRGLASSLNRLAVATGGLTLLSILASVLVAMALASRITRPVEELTAGALDIAEGHFGRRLDIRSNDEIQILAETFNHMAERLKENVAQLEDSNKRLAALNEELKELDRMKSDLLANVSHELRTPLTAIKGYTDYMLERKLGSIGERQEKGLIVIQRNLDRLSRSISALLDFSRMDVARVPLNIQPFGLALLVEQIHATLGSEMDKKRLRFTADIEASLPPVIGDREKLAQVLENLVMNAVKFTPDGGSIQVFASRTESQGRRSVEIRVKDSGIGIPQDQLERVFQRFHQVDGSTTRRFGGVGLGLAIVKSILDAHGTTIAVESEEGRGAQFRFTLPLLEKPAREESVAGRAGGLVLAAGDSHDAIRLIRTVLEEEGFSVISATTAADAEALVSSREPEVVLVSRRLPDRSGIELLRDITRSAATRETTALLLCFTERGLRGRPIVCLLRPVDGRAVAAAVGRLVQGIAQAEPTVLVHEGSDAAELAREAFGSERVRTVRGGSQQTLQALARLRSPVAIVDLATPAGVELLEAMDGNDATAGIPVAALSPRTGELDRARGPGAAARGPANRWDVRALVAEVRRRAGQQGRVEGNQRAV
jgi:signal transduction histidine kinase/DNA-binding response OmpR family regulator